MAAGNLPVARSSSKQAMSLVVSDDNPRLQSVLVWLAKEAAKEAAVVAAVAAVIAKSYARAQRHCDEALRLGALASDPRLVSVKSWLANEAEKEAAIGASVAHKSAGNARLAKGSAEEAARLDADRDEPRLKDVAAWLVQEDRSLAPCVGAARRSRAVLSRPEASDNTAKDRRGY